MKASNALALTVAIALFAASGARAVTVVECVEKGGTTSFRDRCPPGTEKKSQKEIHSPRRDADANIRDAAKNSPVTLYAVAHCEACDLVRQQLSSRRIPFTEKTVDEDPDAQAALKKAAGQLTVPTVTVGAQIFTGYSRDALDQGLTQAGYPDDKPAPPAPAAATPPPGESPQAAPEPDGTPATTPAQTAEP